MQDLYEQGPATLKKGARGGADGLPSGVRAGCPDKGIGTMTLSSSRVEFQMEGPVSYAGSRGVCSAGAVRNPDARVVFPDPVGAVPFTFPHLPMALP